MTEFEKLQNAFKKIKSGSEEVGQFYSLLWGCMASFSAEERKHAIELSKQFEGISTLHKAWHLTAYALYYTFISDYNNAIAYCGEAIKIFENANESGGIMSCKAFLAICYRSIGQLDNAQTHLQNALQLSEQISEKSMYVFGKRITHYQAGELNSEFRNYKEAIKHYEAGLEFSTDPTPMRGRLLSGLGVSYINTGEWDKAIENLNKAKEIISATTNYLFESKIYSDIGIYHFKRQEYDLALESQKKSLQLRIDHNFLNPTTTNYVLLADIYCAKGDLVNALANGKLAIEQSEKLKTIIKLYEAHAIVARIYERMGDFREAYHHYKKFHELREEVHNQEVIRKIEQLNSRHKMESLEKEQEIFKLHNVELKSAFDEIENKQKEILDSIHYAKRIQNALLPPEKGIEKCIERLKGIN